MTSIKIYSSSFLPLATFFEGEYDKLKYKNATSRVGDCSFTLRLDSGKATDTNLQHYNRVEIIEDGVVKFTGYVINKSINLDTVDLKCKSLIGILQKRVLSGSYATNGQFNTVAETLLDTINTDDDTGIIVGALDDTSAVNKVHQSSTAYEILESLADSVGAQFEVDASRQLNIKQQIGQDLSDSVLFQYDILNTQSANILSFQVSDDGEEITTKVYGKAGVRNSTKENTSLTSKYGKLEKFEDYRTANSQTDLDTVTEQSIQANIFSPEIELSPDIADNFNVGDTVRVKLRNNLITLDDSFQVLEKTVEYIGKQKRISVRISDLTNDFVDQVGEIKKKLKLLEQNV